MATNPEQYLNDVLEGLTEGDATDSLLIVLERVQLTNTILTMLKGFCLNHAAFHDLGA